MVTAEPEWIETSLWGVVKQGYHNGDSTQVTDQKLFLKAPVLLSTHPQFEDKTFRLLQSMYCSCSNWWCRLVQDTGSDSYVICPRNLIWGLWILLPSEGYNWWTLVCDCSCYRAIHMWRFELEHATHNDAMSINCWHMVLCLCDCVETWYVLFGRVRQRPRKGAWLQKNVQHWGMLSKKGTSTIGIAM